MPKQIKKQLIILDEKRNSIKYLNSLKNGYFISSSKNEFKIYELSKTKEKIQYKIIQTFKYKYLTDIDIVIESKISKRNKSNKANKANKKNKKNNINNSINNNVNNNDL